MKTKEKILLTSIELFNKNGVQAISTNHIAKALDISPGNLYFHYDNKEEILAQLFRRMCKETYQLWLPKKSKNLTPLQFIDENFELYWKYRFFHREMYSLRRKDSGLARMWRAHIKKMLKMMNILYLKWVRQGYMNKVSDVSEMQYVSESVFAMATTFLQFFESAEKIPAKKSIERGKSHLARLLFPYTLGSTRAEFEGFLSRPN